LPDDGKPAPQLNSSGFSAQEGQRVGDLAQTYQMAGWEIKTDGGFPEILAEVSSLLFAFS
jgi:hypothetical protein